MLCSVRVIVGTVTELLCKVSQLVTIVCHDKAPWKRTPVTTVPSPSVSPV